MIVPIAMKLDIFIDGASRGNPGPAGIGIVIQDADGRSLKKIREYLGEATNNIAEYKALVHALIQADLLKAKELNIHTDSRLLVNQLNKSYKVKDAEIKVLYNEALNAIRNFEKVKVAYIERSQNKMADKLANEAIDNFKGKSKIESPKDVAIFENKKDASDSLF